MMMSIKLVRMGLGRKSYLKKRMNTKEKDDKKQKEANGLQRSINMAWRYVKEIGDNSIKSYLTKEEKIWDVQDGAEDLDVPRVQYKVLEYKCGITAIGPNLELQSYIQGT